MTDSLAILKANILIVDDLEANVEVLTKMLASSGYTSIQSTMNPLEVCDLHRKHCYDLILLDLLMPGMDGFQVMEGLNDIEKNGYLPVLVITAQPGQKMRALQAGAKDFLTKPIELPEVLARVRNMLEVRLLHKALNSQKLILEQRVLERTADLKNSFQETIFTMMRAAEHKDEDTGGHVQRISHYCRELARIICLDSESVEMIFLASPMHDIGKIGIPDHILLKNCGLSPEEWDVMKAHTSMGAKIIGDSSTPCLMMSAEIALNHHERNDGGGYPNSKKGDEIPVSARITNICDIYDALRSKRPYKPALDHLKAINIITRGDGRTKPEHFSSEIIQAFEQNNQVFSDIFDRMSE